MRRRLTLRHFERGRSFELQECLDEALRAYRQACALEPDIPEPYLALGRLEATQGRCEAALAALDSAVRYSVGGRPDNEILEWRAYVLGRMRRFDDALADYLRIMNDGAPVSALRDTSHFGRETLSYVCEPIIRTNAGRMLLALRRYDEADVFLRYSGDPAAQALTDSLPRYREFDGRDPGDDARALHYLFAGTLVIGTLGDGGLPLANTRYLLLTGRHVAVTLGRFAQLVEQREWQFDVVAACGAHHGPVGYALAELLGLPITNEPAPYGRVLLASAIVSGPDDAEALRRPWEAFGAEVFHLAVGLTANAQPNSRDPRVVGLVAPSAVYWYRVDELARRETIEGGGMPDPDGGAWPGFITGPVYVNPNAARVGAELAEECRSRGDDPFVRPVLDYFQQRHLQTRAFEWDTDG